MARFTTTSPAVSTYDADSNSKSGRKRRKPRRRRRRRVSRSGASNS